MTAWAGRRILGRALALLVDPTILLSFDRTGFRIHALAFDPADLDVDLRGRRCLITGANSGIGYETARALAQLGADVVLLCRDRARGEAAAGLIRDDTGSRRVVVEPLDVSDLTAVRAAGVRLARDPVDVLVHNAGILPDRRIDTADGLEATLATHVIGPHLLTHLLRPALERSADGRVVFVSSGGMYTRRLDVAALGAPPAASYDGVTAYADTKRAQVVLAELWAEAFAGTRVTVASMHPGWADTPAVRVSLPRFHRVMQAVLRTPAEGADTVVWLSAAAAARALNGRFCFDRAPRATHLLPWTHESAAERCALWNLCERYVRETAPESTALPHGMPAAEPAAP